MKIRLFGIPGYAGALHSGTEQAPDSLRKVGFVERLEEAGLVVEDRKDIIQDRELIRHNVAPVRNWPSPRIVWEAVYEKAEEIFCPEEFTLLMGGDCSMMVGTYHAFRKVHGPNTHLIVIDGHVDVHQPQGDRCIGAAGMGLWFLLDQDRTWWNLNPIPASSVTVAGAHTIPANTYGLNIFSLQDLQENNGFERLVQHIRSIPQDAKIFVHFDVDVLNEQIMPAAYAPSENGMNQHLASQLFDYVLKDSRVMGMEITEYCPAKDSDGKSAEVIMHMVGMLKNREN
ncbi:MAG: arginase family protein [Bacillaceae bacterium]|nr:arginase family protein [Bacillaceae bacterium]